MQCVSIHRVTTNNLIKIAKLPEQRYETPVTH